MTNKQFLFSKAVTNFREFMIVYGFLIMLGCYISMIIIFAVAFFSRTGEVLITFNRFKEIWFEIVIFAVSIPAVLYFFHWFNNQIARRLG